MVPSGWRNASWPRRTLWDDPLACMKKPTLFSMALSLTVLGFWLALNSRLFSMDVDNQTTLARIVLPSRRKTAPTVWSRVGRGPPPYPSGRYLGQYKAALHDVLMLNQLILYGFAPERRLLSVTTLVEEEDGKLYLSKLRVIHFVEADYNLFLKLLYTYCMVCTAEKGWRIERSTARSRRPCTTVDAYPKKSDESTQNQQCCMDIMMQLAAMIEPSTLRWWWIRCFHVTFMQYGIH